MKRIDSTSIQSVSDTQSLTISNSGNRDIGEHVLSGSVKSVTSTSANFQRSFNCPV